MGDEVKERENIAFSFKDFWCEEKRLSEDVCLVYGKLYLWWESEDRKVRIDMDSRFSILYRRREDGWKIVHVHQSLPNPEQMEGEYYPKTLTEQVKEVTNLADQMRRLAQKDGLTGVINYRAFNRYTYRPPRRTAGSFSSIWIILKKLTTPSDISPGIMS